MEKELLVFPFKNMPSLGATGDVPIKAASPREVPELALRLQTRLLLVFPAASAILVLHDLKWVRLN